MASPVLGIVIMIGITFTSFGSLVVFATTNHYEKISCENDGIFQSLYDTEECPESDSEAESESRSRDPNAPISDAIGCTEILYEGSGIHLCPVAMT